MGRVEPGVPWTDPDPDEQTEALARRNRPDVPVTAPTVDLSMLDVLAAKVDAVADSQTKVAAKVDGLATQVDTLAATTQPSTVAEAVAKFLDTSTPGKAPK